MSGHGRGHAALRATLGPVLRAAVRLRVEGVENIPLSGPILLASNHLSVTDSTFLPLAVPRPVTFMAKAEYFTGRTVLGRLTARFMTAGGQVPVDRDDRRAAVASLETCLRVLTDGGVFCIYPEGTRSPDGRLHRGRTGVAWLALSSGAPVVPVAMSGTDRVLPPGRTLPRPARVRVAFGKPVDLRVLGGDPGDARSRRIATDAVMAAVAELSGQEYVPRYARP
ncbi:1-acyl-sn-glycerol-3-phosphate acyltransferase [Micromonospora sp. WMMA2032]|uniref:lysophospholipid acyltransferase family protein n=1 Tax=Micromonospora sp. WMMA2032 TaxID=2039870 RepID=UPI000C05B562|nr:lysophospholipid acyltransferase family protein [Micromonospora sp. WMMA2032]ATO13573.1 1-acyl-sn-glycerol-3-phosphate acyltransferase [Micromonospora sp. WMMA2032]